MAGHQPSKGLEKKKTFNEYKQCFTCKMEFDGYYNLMNHRKTVHPSNKKCRNFPKSRTFGKECWYVHSDEPMEVDINEPKVSHSNFKCNLCDEEMTERRDFMKHKKIKHSETILSCQRNLRGECSRNYETCWFNHSPTKDDSFAWVKDTNEKQDFHKVPENAFPPDQVTKMLQLMNTLLMKVEKMEKRFEILME